MRTKYRVKVRRSGHFVWRWDCEACGSGQSSGSTTRPRKRVLAWAHVHAATCEALRRLNWAAACPSCCKLYGGVIAPVCPACQGYGWIKETSA